ncbi:hypothetical protein [Devosia sp.]|uniref:hypothetical protein n=1 Tax=Devosia sp. TaxID=1871048 RepID=UPI00260B28ED|nr:hypothetical protein [Devosia sp.]
MNDTHAVRYAVSATESEGVAQILQLVQQSALEEHWAFLPEAGLWIETGLNENATLQVSEVEVDTDYLVALVSHFPRINLYHFHPAGLGADGTIPVGTPLSEVAASDREAVTGAFPGSADMLATFEITWMLEEAEADAEVRHFVISEFGIVEFGPTEAGRRELGAARHQPQAYNHFDLVMVASVRLGSYNVGRLFDEHRDFAVGELIAQLCQQISSPEYRMGYSPMIVRPSWIHDVAVSSTSF